MSNALFGLLMLMTSFFSVQAQTNTQNFYRHLEVNKLLNEQHSWWLQNQDSREKMPKAYANYLLRTDKLPEFYQWVLKYPTLLSDSCLNENASREFLLTTETSRKMWFELLESKGINGYSQELYQLAQEKDRLWLPAFDSRIYPAFVAMRSAQKKNLPLAISLDLLLPGAGKAYLGMPRHGLQSAFVMALFGWATFESVKRTGPKSALSYLNYTAMTTIYLSNVFGTAYQYKTRKINFQTTYFEEVYKYTSLYSCD